MQFCDIIVVYFENHTELLNSMWTACRVFPFKADGPVIYCALRPIHTQHAVPMPFPCHAVSLKGFRMCLSHLIYTVGPCLIHTCHAASMPFPDHAVLLKATAQHGRWEAARGLPARVLLLPATTRSSTNIVIRSITILLTTIHTYDCKEW
jgi:hypothetical protein